MIRRVGKAAVAAAAALFLVLPAQAINYMTLKPMSQVVRTGAQSCAAQSGPTRVPVIAWGGDIATSYANGSKKRTVAGSLMDKAHLNIELYRQDDFAKQVADYMSCRTPFLRGTLGMLTAASDVTSRDPRTDMVVIYQMTWSAGGDALVVRQGIEKPADLKGKTIAVQAYGPHMDYLTTILRDAGLKPGDVHIKWVRDLIELDHTSSSPAMALRSDSSVDAAFVISPDALALTSGGAVGTGGEDSVRGAHILLSTKTANRVISDVYAVRRDYFDSHKAKVQAFVNALMQADEQTRTLFKERQTRASDYKTMIEGAALLLLDSADAVEDTAAMYGDAEFVGFSGNVRFFTDLAYPRGFKPLTTEIQSSFEQLGLLSSAKPIADAGWSYNNLAVGISDTSMAEAPRFNKSAVDQLVARRQSQNSASEGELFRFEIYFAPNQNTFPADQYRAAFDQVINLASTYGGALLTIEGHSDPLGYLRRKKAGASVIELSSIKQASRNLSYTRANAVRQSIINYAHSKGITLDPSQFGVSGLGVSRPNTPGCSYDATGDISLTCAPKTKAQWNATRRVVFRVIQVEAEPDVFRPL
ncbi:ABC transporter substrate-binding protein [Kordiimonas marina]|uniref:ABC transporter substrate-binding protein n=1 Tax=Kordiimonas marina TaxID=2872312 RepID=UPI001FF1364F|nr:ABC transporter substrate-binding protein [Kordiimonas marina]MCJ9430066.1 ABC transporter substrate-binding protein [Kordiimonas marina]